MARLPNFAQAVIPIEKLRDYALNMEHPEGRNKAIVFKEMLAIERRHAAALRGLVLESLSTAPAEQRGSDEYGDRWTTYHEIVGLNGKAAIVTAGWVIKKDEDQAPELATCYIEVREQEKLRRLLGSA